MMRTHLRNVTIGLLMLAATDAATAAEPTMRLELNAPINTWDEAVPLGNGLLGGLLWGSANTIRLSLDRGDLWDERPATGVHWNDFNYATMQRLVRENKNGELNAIFDHPYNQAHPSKLPAGRLEITLDPALQARSFDVDLAATEGHANLQNGQRLNVFFSAAQPVALCRIPGAEPQALKLLPPQSVKNLGYPLAQNGSEGRALWFVQEAADGLRYCVCVESRRDDDSMLLAATVASTKDGADPVKLARERVAAALAEGYDKAFRPHREYWNGFWARSRVTIPDVDIQRHYNLVQYFYGAASRRGAPPMPLQGVWTADAGSLPPWKGDYHNDLNTQMTYIAYHAAGHFDEGACYLDFLWNLLPTFRKFAKDFYDAPGAAVPGVMTLAGQPLGGWGHYSLSPTMGAWSGHLFYLHWRYTCDDAFLRERAYPWCREVGQCLRHLLKPDDKGVLKLPLSTSPEIHDNSARAWLVPNTNYDLACLRMFLLALAEMADACGESAASKEWADAAGALGAVHVNADGALKLDAKEDLAASHRHLSNIISLHPFNLTTADGAESDHRIIAASLKQWDKLGTGAWCGYSFSWMACLRARAGDAEAALRNLEIYTKAFILRNGFHANGDQTRSGFSGFQYRPFTLEGNFLAAQAVHEMLLQSWSPTPGTRDTEVIRVFPAMPWRWHDAAFADLRTEGGHRVSARRENNATTWLRVTAGRNGVVRIRDNFGGRAPQWNREDVKKAGVNFEVTLKASEALEAALPRLAAIPDKPADAAEPLVIRKPGVMQANRLPLHIGADSNGQNRFTGDIGRASVFNRVLKPEELKLLADPANNAAQVANCVVSWDFKSRQAKGFVGAGTKDFVAEAVGDVAVVDTGNALGKAARFTGAAFLKVPHDAALDCLDGLTLEAWIRPEQLPPNGARIMDKSPAGAASAYLLDTYPGNSLRLIIRDPHLKYDARLPVGEWTHVAATVDGTTGSCALYVNARKVAE